MYFEKYLLCLLFVFFIPLAMPLLNQIIVKLIIALPLSYSVEIISRDNLQSYVLGACVFGCILFCVFALIKVIFEWLQDRIFSYFSLQKFDQYLNVKSAFDLIFTLLLLNSIIVFLPPKLNFRVDEFSYFGFFKTLPMLLQPIFSAVLLWMFVLLLVLSLYKLTLSLKNKGVWHMVFLPSLFVCSCLAFFWSFPTVFKYLDNVIFETFARTMEL